MSELEGVEQHRVDEPARTRSYEERLRIAKHVAQVLLAAGIDCELAEEGSAH